MPRPVHGSGDSPPRAAARRLVGMGDASHLAEDRPAASDPGILAMVAALVVALVGGGLAVLVVLSVFGFTDIL